MSRPVASTCAKPAMVLISIGKNVITTMTAALEGQSKPNHITMMGATPTTGTALTKLPSGSRPRCRKGTRSIKTATRKPRPHPAETPYSPRREDESADDADQTRERPAGRAGDRGGRGDGGEDSKPRAGQSRWRGKPHTRRPRRGRAGGKQKPDRHQRRADAREPSHRRIPIRPRTTLSIRATR